MENNKPQIIFIHGGDAFRDVEKLYEMLRDRSFNPYEVKKKWREEIIKNLADTHECHALAMPNSSWANYEAWKIWFEKMVPYMRSGLVFVGHSLGASFLIRYLSENTLPVSVSQLHLLSPVVSQMDDCEGFLINEISWSGFINEISAVHLWHSQDDTIVPISHSEKLLEMYPSAIMHRFTDKGHFLASEFPELEAVIKTA